MRELLIAYIEPPQRTDENRSYYHASEQALAMSRINDIYVITMATLHRRVNDVVRDADVLVLRNICEPDFLSIIQDRKKHNKLTVYELADDLSSAQHPSVFFDFYKNIADQNVSKLLLHVCDGVQFHKPELERIYGYLNPYTIVFTGQFELNGMGTSSVDELIEFYRVLGERKTVVSTDTAEGKNAFQRLSMVSGARLNGRHLLLNHTRFEDLLYDGLVLKYNKNEQEKAAGCFQEAMELSPESHLPYVFGASCLPDPIKALQEALKRKPQSVTTWLILAEEYLKQNKITDYMQALESMARIAPDYTVPYIRAAGIMRHLHRKRDWLSLVDRAQSSLRLISPSANMNDHGYKPSWVKPNRPKRVLLLASDKGMVYHDCVYGFRQLGWETMVESFGHGTHKEADAHEKLSLRIFSYNPCLVLSINQVGCDFEGYILSALKHAGIPAIIWYVDNPFALLPENNYKMVKDASILACFDSSYVEDLQKQTGVTSVHLPIATNPNRFHPPRTAHFIPEWDISFVGSLALDMVHRQRSALEKDHPSLIPLVDDVVQQMGAGISVFGFNFFKDRAILLGIDWDALPRALQERLCIVAETAASAHKRIRVISQMEDLGIKVIGGSEWRQYVRSEQIFPPVDYLRGLCQVYQNTRINLNISKLQLRAGITQRIFDVTASGGFLLTDRTPELEHYLQPNEEVGVYEDIDEVKEKAKYYLSHEKERVQMAAKARQRILQKHTYVHRMEKIVNLLGAC